MHKILTKYSKSANIAHSLDEEMLLKIGTKVLLGYEEDLKSNTEWLSDIKQIEELAKLYAPKKNTPLPNSSNVKFPIITKACYEFSSRTYPEIVRDGKVVKARVIGRDFDNSKAAQGERVSEYMNYKLLFEDNEWERELDNLLMRVSLVGFMCRKSFYDPIRKKIKSILCDPTELIVNSEITSLEEAPRISHILHWRLNDLIEYKNKIIKDESLFLEKPVDELMALHKTDELNKCIDGIEQCTYLDLDDDGYLEPYIVTVTKEHGKVLRIVAQFTEDDVVYDNDQVCYINKVNLYEDYHFLPNPTGKYQSVGFGILLLHLTESINSVLNQLIDSGQLANMKGGYMDSRLKHLNSSNSLKNPGQFDFIKVMAGASLRDGILPVEYGEPSNVLFQLLGLLIEAARDLSSSTQILSGTQSSENAKTGATLALQQEGKKIFSSINRRIYRSLTKGLRNIFKLYSVYADPLEYYEVLDDKLAIKKSDFDATKVNIIPVADPNLASDVQRLGEAQFVQQALLQGLPGIDPLKATKFILKKTMIAGIESILVDETQPQPPNPQLIKIQAEIEGQAQELNIKGAQLDIQQKDLMIKAHLAEAQIKKMECECIALLAKAESEDVKLRIQDYQLQFQAISKKIDTELDLNRMAQEREVQLPEQIQQPVLPPESTPGEVNDPTEGV